MAKVGIIGGTFNPPHTGHLILAQDVAEQLGLEQVFFIPAASPPHKGQSQPAPQKRLEMTRIATAGNPNFKTLDIEIKRGGTSYTADTIIQLKKSYPADKFFLIIGSDLANSFHEWKDPDKIKKNAVVVVAKRQGSPLKQADGFRQIDITQIGISSSRIRQKAKENKSIKYLVCARVEEYIKNNDIYIK